MSIKIVGVGGAIKKKLLKMIREGRLYNSWEGFLTYDRSCGAGGPHVKEHHVGGRSVEGVSSEHTIV